MDTNSPSRHAIESPYAWARLGVSLLLMTIGGSGMYSVAVVKPIIVSVYGNETSARAAPNSAASSWDACPTASA